MAVMVRFGRHKAFLRKGEWRCASRELEADLNRFTRSWVQRDADVRDLDAALEAAIAKAASEKFGGKMLLQTDPQNRRAEDPYFRLRQLDLFEL